MLLLLVLFLLQIDTYYSTIARCSCEQIYWENECDEANCFWKNEICILIQCENRITQDECDKVTLTSDWNPYCKWVNNTCYDMDTYTCETCDESTSMFCQSNDGSCEIAATLDRQHCSDFATSNCSTQLGPYEFCEKQGHNCASVTYDTKCNDILTQTACEGLGCYWNTNLTYSCNAKDCIYFESKENCSWAINSDRDFTYCSWNSTKAFCQEASEGDPFLNISSCSIDSKFIFHYDNSTGNNLCQACVDPQELFIYINHFTISFILLHLF